MKKYLLIFLMLGSFVVSCQNQGNGTYPSKEVAVIVPYSAGGGSDSIVRALVASAKEYFPKNIIVENRTGGAGAIGMLYGANAKPDGYVISMVAVELTILPHLGTGQNLSPSLFRPVLLFNSDYSAITVPTDSSWSNLNDFISAAKTENLRIGNSGIGSIWHFAAVALAQNAGVSFNYIPFDGAAPAITSLLGGHIDAVSVSYPEVAPYLKSGDLKVLGYLANDKIKGSPRVRTAKEQGYDVSVGTWRGLAVPKNTPDEVVDQLYNIFSKAMDNDSFKKFMSETGFGIEIKGPDDFQSRMDKDFALYKKLAKDIQF